MRLGSRAAIPCAASTEQNRNRPAAGIVIQYARKDRCRNGSATSRRPGFSELNVNGQPIPGPAFKTTIASPSPVPTAAIFARNIVRVRMGSGDSTSTSRRSGNVESQLSTAKRPTISIVVEIKKCSAVQLIVRNMASGILL